MMKWMEKFKKTSRQDKRKLKKLVEGRSFDLMIMSLILFNAVVLGLLATPEMAVYDRILFVLDRLCLAIFIAEILMKIYVYGRDFFKNGWNVFDFAIIALSAVPLTSYFIVLRTFRLFLLLHYISRCNRLKQVLGIFVGLLPSFAAMLTVLAIFFYVFAVMAVSLFGGVFLEFATLGSSLFALLQVFTLDGWASGIARPVMIEFPHAWLFFTTFVLLSFLLVISFVISAVAEVVRKSTGIFPKVKL